MKGFCIIRIPCNGIPFHSKNLMRIISGSLRKKSGDHFRVSAEIISGAVQIIFPLPALSRQ